MALMQQKGWHSRGYLPHFDGRAIQFVTFHLGDSLPLAVIRRYKLHIDAGKVDRYYSRELQIKIEQYLDRGIGKCHLAKPEVALMVEGALLYYDNKRYQLLAWVIMPNHVHILISVDENVSLTAIIKDLKGYTSRKANKMLGLKGRFSHPDYFDRYIRDANHYSKAIRYIERNPVKAGLAVTPEEWPYGSARTRLADKDVRVPTI